MTIGHLNWAYLKAPWGDPRVAPFCDAVDKVNAIAERSAGFVWRAELDQRSAMRLLPVVRVTDGPTDPDRFAATLSVWEEAAALDHFVHKTLHGAFLARRGEWFVPQGVPTYVVWPLGKARTTHVADARARMKQLIEQGPSPEAYDLAWMRAQAA